jgi:hypothetical protein
MNWLIVIVLLALAGCSSFNIRNIDQPAPPAWKAWAKPGATELDIKKAVLECGAPDPEVNGFIYEAAGIKDFDEQMNHFFLTNACMEKAGFIDRWGSVKRSCSHPGFPKRRDYPACQRDAVIPQRSVELRLNSWLCKLETDREYCRKHAVVPKACDDPKRDYNNPPPECRP